MGYKNMELKLSEQWKLQYEFELVDLAGGFFRVRFGSKADYHRVMYEGPWVVQGYYVTVSKWRPGF